MNILDLCIVLIFPSIQEPLYTTLQLDSFAFKSLKCLPAVYLFLATYEL